MAALERAFTLDSSRHKLHPGAFQNTYLLSGSGFRAGLVQQTDQIVASHDLSLFVRRHLTGAHSISAVAFSGANCQTVGLLTQPLHSCFCAIRCVKRLLHAIAVKLDLVVYGVALEGTRAVKVLDSDVVLSVATEQLKKCSFWAAPLAKPLIGYGDGSCTRRTGCNDLCETRTAVVASSDE